MAEDRTVTIKIGGDAAQLLAVLNQIQEQLKASEKKAKAAEEALSKIPKAVPYNSQGSMPEAEETYGSANEFGSMLHDLNRVSVDVDETMRKAKLRATEFGNELVLRTEEAADNLKQIDKEDILGKAVELRRRRMESDTQAWQSQSMHGIVPDDFIPKADRLDAFIKKLKDAGKEVEDLGQKVSDGSAKIIKSIVALAAGAAGVVSGLVAVSSKIGGDFESQMIRVQSLSNATGEQFEKLTAKAREMGATLPITAREAAQTMTVLAQLGTKAEELGEFAEAAVNLAITQQAGADQAAGVIKRTMTQFNLDTEQLSRVVDSLNNASNISALDLNSIGEALKYAAPNAKMLNMDLEETLATLVALSNAGMDGGLGGRGLSAIMGTLSEIGTNDKALNVLRRLNVAVRDVTGDIRDWRDVMRDIKNSDYTAGDIFSIFGKENADVANTLMQNIDKLGEYRQELDQTGTTARMLKREMESFENVWKSLGSATESINISFFDQIKDQSIGVIQTLTEMAHAVNEWIKKTDAGGKVFAAFLRGLGVSFSQSGFKEWLDSLDIDAVAKTVEGLAAGLRSVGETGAWIIGMLRPVFSFLIDNMTLIGKIAAAMWVVGKVEQYAGMLMNVYAAFQAVTGGIATLSNKLLFWNTAISALIALILLAIELKARLDAASEAKILEQIETAANEGLEELAAAMKGNAEAAKKLSGAHKIAFDEIQKGGEGTAGIWMKFAHDMDVLGRKLSAGLIKTREYTKEANKLGENLYSALAAAEAGPAVPAEKLKLQQEIIDTWMAGAMSVKGYADLLHELAAGGDTEVIAEKFKELYKTFGKTNVKDLTSIWDKALHQVEKLLPDFTKRLNEGINKGLTRQEAFDALKDDFDLSMQEMCNQLKEVHGPAVVAAFRKMTDKSMEALRGLSLDEMTDSFKRMNAAAEAGFLGKKFGLQQVAKNWKDIKEKVAETVKNLKGIPKNALKAIIDDELLDYLDEAGDKIAALKGRTPKTLNDVILNVNTALEAMSGHRSKDRRNEVALGVSLPDLNAKLEEYEKAFPQFRKNFLGRIESLGGTLGKDMAAALSGSMKEGDENLFANMLGAGGDSSIEAIKEFKRHLDQMVKDYQGARKTVETQEAPVWKLFKPEDIKPSENAGAVLAAGRSIGKDLMDGIKSAAGEGGFQETVNALVKTLNADAESLKQAGQKVGSSIMSGLESALTTGVTAKLTALLDIDATATGAKVGKSFSDGFMSGLDLSGIESNIYDAVMARLGKDAEAAGA